jgi:hypothetical protein
MDVNWFYILVEVPYIDVIYFCMVVLLGIITLVLLLDAVLTVFFKWDNNVFHRAVFMSHNFSAFVSFCLHLCIVS